MKNRLSWKILIAFWVTFFCVIPALWLPLALSMNNWQTPQEGVRAYVGTGTPPSAPQAQRPAAQAGKPSIWMSTQWQALLVGGLAGLGFSVLLARYLVRPVQDLRSAFERLRQGDFSVRLSPRMGRRHDEIADLAHDFDAMAGQLDALVNARDRLLHDVSHELRSPLSRLQLAIGLLRQSPERREDLLDRVETEAQRLSDMVGEILTLARSESQTSAGDVYFDPLSVLRDLVDDAAFEANQFGVSIETRFAPLPEQGILTCTGQEELFSRAIDNILRNAIRFSPAGSAIRIAVDRAPDGDRPLRIQVRDSGPGVSPDILGSVFDPFFSARESGFGLGLSIARRAIVAQRGTIEILNEDAGLRVIIRVPVAQTEAF